MTPELSIRIAGAAGQGMQTVGAAMCGTFKRCGLSVFAHQDNMSRVRGGSNFYQIRCADRPVQAPRGSCEIVVALDKKSIGLHRDILTRGGVMIFDREKLGVTDEPPGCFTVPLSAMAKTAGGKELYVNSVACGVLAAITGMPFGPVREVLTQAFAEKGREIVDANVRSAQAGFDYVAAHFDGDRFHLPVSRDADRLLMDGNEAVALGAIGAGVKFYSAYPMTPSTTIMENVARFAGRYGIVVEQAEDEIAAINMCIGASAAGVRAMTGTSGGGFALMIEGFSLAGMTESPVVVAVGQRPGPATGLPTRTEQADLDLCIHAGHGEFARAVFTPGTREQAFALTARAFDTAERFQVPVIVMTDQHLAESVCTCARSSFVNSRNRRHLLLREGADPVAGYRRYHRTGSGVSPRAVPSWIAEPVYVDSDEHDETGHITEDAAVRRAMVEKRLYKKTAGLRGELLPPDTAGLDKVRTVLVGFGSTLGVIREVAGAGRETGVGYIHYTQVWPFPSEAFLALYTQAGQARLLTVENNAAGQLARLIARETGVRVAGSLLKYDGRPFTVEEVATFVQEKS